MTKRQQELLQEILQLSPADRLEMVERIWDSLAEFADEVPVPDWHREELERRLSDPADKPTLSWNDVRARLKKEP